MSIKVCENVPSVTIFGNFCVIWALLRKVELFLTEVESSAEFIVTSLGLFHTAIRECDSGSRMTCPMKLH